MPRALQVLLKVCVIYYSLAVYPAVDALPRATIPRFLGSALRSPSLIVVPDSALFRTYIL